MTKSQRAKGTLPQLMLEIVKQTGLLAFVPGAPRPWDGS